MKGRITSGLSTNTYGVDRVSVLERKVQALERYSAALAEALKKWDEAQSSPPNSRQRWEATQLAVKLTKKALN